LLEPIDKGAVLKFDKSWEGPFSAYCTINDNGEKLQLYYRGFVPIHLLIRENN